MFDKDNLKFTDYVKITEMKNYILTHLESMGLKDEVRTMNDEDLDKLMNMMSILGDQLKIKHTDEEKIEMLISYVICLWTKLIVSYGAKLTEL